MKNWKTQLATGAGLLSLLGSTYASAQGGYDNRVNNSNDRRDALVTLYEDCDFRGASRSINVGEYRTMRSIDFGNDRVSSIKVPRGLEVVIYEDDKFRGDYARIKRDLLCFDNNWNDQVSSLKVVSSNDNRDARRGDDRNNDVRRDERRRSGDRDRRGLSGDSNVTGKNVAQVVFGSSVLQQVNRKQWQLTDPRAGVSQFKETRRDNDSVYLQNDYSAERVRIDLFANDITFTNRDGRSKRFDIARKEAALTAAPRARSGDQLARSNDSPNRTIRSDCFNFKAYTKGGGGGLRFHGKEDFYRFDKKAKTGRVCHKGTLTMEINKTDPNTEVVVEIDNNRYRFAKNEHHDALKNNWYRKKVKLKVGR